MEINGRLVIPVQQQYQNSVGIVHDASRSGKTCYVEPTEIVGPTNELRQAEAELRSEEARVDYLCSLQQPYLCMPHATCRVCSRLFFIKLYLLELDGDW